jgi:hypothetical protein
VKAGVCDLQGIPAFFIAFPKMLHCYAGGGLKN